MFKKLFLGFMALAMTAVTFVSFTYAWLSLNSEAWVEGMSIQASGGEGFLMSVDGTTYVSNLSKNDIFAAIICSYDKSYHIHNGKLLNSQGEEVTDLEKLFEQIRLSPCTSVGSDDLTLRDLNGEALSAAGGQYYEFDLYFRATAQIEETLDIYLNGNDTTLTTGGVEYKIPKTDIKAGKPDKIVLKSPLCTFNRSPEKYGQLLEIEAGETLTVWSHNAMRLGFSGGLSNATIVELTDNNDLGSYATNIRDYLNPDDELYDKSLGNLNDLARYDATKNAMFTFYNGLRGEPLKAIDYKKEKPETYRSLTDGSGKNCVKVCSLSQEGEAVKVNFKLWLEGWDADCFNGIGKQIQVQLSFAQY